MKTICRLACLGFLSAGFALPWKALAAQGYPKTPPAPGPLTPIAFPPFHEERLPNGVRLLVVESHKQPIVSLSLSFSAGSSFDPAGKEGLAELVAGLLSKGAGDRTAEQVADAIEGTGGTLQSSAGSDFLSINATVLTPSLPLAFELIGDAVKRPTFAEKELELLRTQTLSGLQVELSQPSSIAGRRFRAILYGSHPYARGTTPSSVRAITRDDLLAFQRERLRPTSALLVIAGAVSPADARRMAIAAFQGWSGGPPPPLAAPSLPARTRVEITLVHRPGSVQSNILAGNLTFLPNDPRFYATEVMNQVLGGGASSRLFLVLREAKSWTYGAYSDYVRRKGTGYFIANTEVRTEVTDSALRELLHQVERIRTEPIAGPELDAAKGALVGRYPLTIETADQVASAVASAQLYGRPADFVQTYRVKLGAVTAQQAQSAAQTTIHPDQLAIVVVGDGTKIYDELKAIAPTTIVDPEGKPLTSDDLAPHPTALDLDLSALVPRRDSFTVRFQGNPIGWQSDALEATPGGFRYTERVELGGFVSQTTTLDLDKSAAMQAVQQTGKTQGQDVSIDVKYANGRAAGTAKTPDPATRQIKSVTIDTAVTPGTLDDNAIQALLPAFRWTPDAKWTFNVMSAGQGEIKIWSLAVTGSDSVTVGGQPVEAYRAELTGGQSPLTLWISKQSPHTLLKLGIAGQPVEFVRVP